MIIEYLENACQHLRVELEKVTKMVFVTHDNLGIIEVYADASIKAYVPKKFDSWDVDFVEWNGEDITYELDEELAG